MADSGSSAVARTFETWAQVSRWATEMHDPQAVPDATVAAKSSRVNCQLQERVRSDPGNCAIRATVAIHLNQTSVSVGETVIALTRLRKSLPGALWGLQRQANLMRAMLKSVNITAYPIVISSVMQTHVKEEWASPRQFNHCIIAVKVSDETESPTIIQPPDPGPLTDFRCYR